MSRQKYVLRPDVPAAPPQREAASINQTFAQDLYYYKCEMTIAEREAKRFRDPLHEWLWSKHE
jgi:hypothetical protein